jgi:hypothetical protein
MNGLRVERPASPFQLKGFVMSNTVIRTVLNKGTKQTLLHFYLESDGVEGELKNYVLLDPTVYDSLYTDKIIRPDMKLRVKQVWYSLGWFDALLSFDDLVPSPSWLLTRDGCGHADFRHFGGIAQRYIEPQDKKSSDRKGQLLLTTKDFAPFGSMGTIVLEIGTDAS